MNKKITIFYTTDLHGALGSINDNFTISNLANYIYECPNDYLLFDNGDNLQGSPLNDIWIESDQKVIPLVCKTFNKLKYDVVNLGNHDFNYGLNTLLNYTNKLDATVLSSNTLYKDKLLYEPYKIITIDNIKIGVIGVVTQYIPNWEKKENIIDITFPDAFLQAKKYLNEIKDKVDLTVILYHGGYENDLTSGKQVLFTNENEGYKMLTELDCDILLCGHQHTMVHPVTLNNTFTMLAQSHAKSLGCVDITFTLSNGIVTSKKISGKLLKPREKCETIELLSKDEVNKVNEIANKEICTIENGDLLITDPFLARLNNHLLFTITGDALKEAIDCDIFVLSLANVSNGFTKRVTYKNILENYPYPNSYIVMEISALDFKKEVEKSLSYFTLKDGKIVINDKFINPKIEHYNYDVIYGIDYSVKVTNDKNIITSFKYNGKNLDSNDTVKICLNNYRAIGGGEYKNYPKGKILKTYDISIQKLVVDYLSKRKSLFVTNKIKCNIYK